MVLADSVYLLSSLGDLFHSRTHSFWLCAAQEMLGNSSAYISSMCIVLLTIERFLAIVCPLEHMQVISRRLILIYHDLLNIDSRNESMADSLRCRTSPPTLAFYNNVDFIGEHRSECLRHGGVQMCLL